MDITQKIYVKLKKILKRLQNLKVIQSFYLKINFCQVEDNFKVSLIEIDSVLKKCLKKIGTKYRRAEIRKVITKLVRNKNLKDVGVQSENEETHVFYGYLDRNSQNSKMDCDDESLQKSSYKKEDCHKMFPLGEKLKEHKTVQMNNNIKNRVDSLKVLKNNQENINEKSLLERKNKLKKVKHRKILKYKKSLIKKKENPEIFTCVCGKVFKFLKTLKKHQNLKHSNKNTIYPCATCDKSFVEKGKLNRHMLSHQSSQLQCSQCLKLFARSDTLKRHLNIAHNLEKKWSCAFCQKKFSLKYNRDVHVENVHKSANEWFQCEHCGGKFKNKLTLKSHLKTHSEKRITCFLCSKTFTRKIHYKTHMKNKHFGISLYQNLLDSVANEDVFSTIQ